MSDQQQRQQPAPMTAERLAEIRARAEAATPGPWTADSERIGPKVIAGGEWIGDVSGPVWTCDDPQDGCMEEAAQWMADAEFMAHARQDMPDLLAFAAAALPILRAVAESRARPGFGVCQHCEAYRLMGEHPRTHAWVVTDDYDHTNDCPVTASRALLAGTAGAEAAQGSE